MVASIEEEAIRARPQDRRHAGTLREVDHALPRRRAPPSISGRSRPSRHDRPTARHPRRRAASSVACRCERTSSLEIGARSPSTSALPSSLSPASSCSTCSWSGASRRSVRRLPAASSKKSHRHWRGRQTLPRETCQIDEVRAQASAAHRLGQWVAERLPEDTRVTIDHDDRLVPEQVRQGCIPRRILPGPTSWAG